MKHNWQRYKNEDYLLFKDALLKFKNYYEKNGIKINEMIVSDLQRLILSFSAATINET